MHPESEHKKKRKEREREKQRERNKYRRRGMQPNITARNSRRIRAESTWLNNALELVRLIIQPIEGVRVSQT